MNVETILPKMSTVSAWRFLQDARVAVATLGEAGVVMFDFAG